MTRYKHHPKHPGSHLLGVCDGSACAYGRFSALFRLARLGNHGEILEGGGISLNRAVRHWKPIPLPSFWTKNLDAGKSIDQRGDFRQRYAERAAGKLKDCGWR